MMILNTFIYFLLFALSVQEVPKPLYQWPLGDKSGLNEVIGNGRSMLHSGNKQCFAFMKNTLLPYQGIGISGEDTPFVFTSIMESGPFDDLTIAMFVYPVGQPSGTLLQYTTESDEKIRIVFDPYEPIMIVSFRHDIDEYNIPAAIVTAENVVQPNTWTRLVVQRMYNTGRIKVFSNGKLVLDEDDDFQNEVSLPAKGRLTIGNTWPMNTDGDQQFYGYITCLQIFTANLTEADISDAWKWCLPSQWKPGSSVYFSRADKSSTLRCITEQPTSSDNLLTITNLINEKRWKEVKDRFKWNDSHENNAYFYLISLNMAPPPQLLTLGFVNASDTKTCTRLCMRVDGCMSVAVNSGNDGVQQCRLYNSLYSNLESEGGFRYYGRK